MDSETQELMDTISRGETLKVEFKSGLKQLPDIMNQSNAEGDDLLLDTNR